MNIKKKFKMFMSTHICQCTQCLNVIARVVEEVLEDQFAEDSVSEQPTDEDDYTQKEEKRGSRSILARSGYLPNFKTEQ